MKYTIWSLALVSCVISCSNASSRIVPESVSKLKEEAGKQRVNDTGFENIVVPDDSICRAYSVPEGLNLKGCKVKGPMQGELVANRYEGPEISLQDALHNCINDVGCTGVSSSWYTGAKWGVFGSPSSFSIDASSYACTFLVGCP
jgi:hypothetical protein